MTVLPDRYMPQGAAQSGHAQRGGRQRRVEGAARRALHATTRLVAAGARRDATGLAMVAPPLRPRSDEGACNQDRRGRARSDDVLSSAAPTMRRASHAPPRPSSISPALWMLGRGDLLLTSPYFSSVSLRRIIPPHSSLPLHRRSSPPFRASSTRSLASARGRTKSRESGRCSAS